MLAILVFSVAYARMAKRQGVFASMTAALLAWALSVALLRSLAFPLWAGFAAVLAALLAAPRLIGQNQDRKGASPAPARDLPWRMAAGAALTLAVTAAAAHMGPRLSGMFAMFPVMSTVLVGFSHRASGPGWPCCCAPSRWRPPSWRPRPAPSQSSWACARPWPA